MHRVAYVSLWIGIQLAVLAAASLPLWYTWHTPAGVQSLASSLALPDDWRQRGYSGERVDYRLPLELDSAPQQPWALFLPSVRTSVDVAINGNELVQDETGAPTSAARMWFRPLVYSVPTGLLRVGSNTVTIALSAPAGRGYLGTPLAGPHAALAPFVRKHRVWRQVLLQVIVVAMIAVGLLMMVLWFRRRGQSIYGLYGVGMSAWALHDLNYIVVNPPLPARYWDALSVALLGGFIGATTFFIHRYIGARRPRVERLLKWCLLIGMPLLFVLPDAGFHAFSEWLWHPVILSFGFYLYVLMYVTAWRRNSAELHLLAMTGSIMVLYGGHDLLSMLGAIPWGSGYLLPYSAAPSLVVFSSLLVHHFARNLDALEALTRGLDLRVRAATQELERNHAQLRALERGRWLTNERERVARDIHDGVGGQLVALLARVKSGEHSADVTESAVTRAMHDLRLVIESLDVAEGDLGTALASWRHGLERRLGESPLRLVWEPGDAPRLPGFGPSEILSVLRLLDEAATNVLRHACASTLTVQYGMCDGVFVVTLADDGRGGAQVGEKGRGIRNMQHRAQALGAELDIRSSERGTTLCLRIVPK
jgi:signal transduction histidine kinase